MKFSYLALALVAAIFLGCLGASGCKTAAQHEADLPPTPEREMTVGLVQKEIKTGMSQAEVAEALGSPNLVTRDQKGLETWVYDKIASEASYSTSTGGTGAVLNLFGVYQERSGATRSSQRTLTVLIKFDADQKVESFTYHSSRF